MLVIGAGGHALVSIDVLSADGHEIAGCLSLDGRATADVDRSGVAMLGRTEDVARFISDGIADVFIAVGDNRTRQALADRVAAAGGRLVRAVSPHAVLSPTVEVSDGALVMPGVVVNAHSQIGHGAIINTRASVDHECRIGAFAHVAPGVSLGGDVTIEEGALVGIGACVTLGRTVGAWSTVGAGSAVIRDVEPGTTVAGVPARSL